MRFHRGGQSAQKLSTADLSIHPRDRLGRLAIAGDISGESTVAAQGSIAALQHACAASSAFEASTQNTILSVLARLGYTRSARARRDLLVGSSALSRHGNILVKRGVSSFSSV